MTYFLLTALLLSVVSLLCLPFSSVHKCPFFHFPSHAQVSGTTLVHEVLIFCSDTECEMWHAMSAATSNGGGEKWHAVSAATSNDGGEMWHAVSAATSNDEGEKWHTSVTFAKRNSPCLGRSFVL